MDNLKYDTLRLQNQLCFPLYAASREIIKNYKPFLDELDLTYTQYITLMLLWENKTMRVKEIGEMLYLDSGTLTPLLKKLGSIKRDPLLTNSSYSVQAMARDVVLAIHDTAGNKMVGIFSLRGECTLLKVPVADGMYENLITGKMVEVHAGVISTDGEPIIFKTER